MNEGGGCMYVAIILQISIETGSENLKEENKLRYGIPIKRGGFSM